MKQFCHADRAMATVRGNGICGKVTFCQRRDGVLVRAEVFGLPASDTDFFAMHIHEGAMCGGTGFPGTGGHFNPDSAAHPRHAGDLPPLLRCGGRAFMTVLTDRFRVGDIVGRTLVIHGGPDDFRSQPGGNAGEKLACGVISHCC